MTDVEALDELIRRTGHEPFRDLVARHPGAMAKVRRMLEGLPLNEPPAVPERIAAAPGPDLVGRDCREAVRVEPTSSAEQLRRIRVMKECLHWRKPGCGCQQGICLDGKGDPETGQVTYEWCFGCLGI